MLSRLSSVSLAPIVRLGGKRLPLHRKILTSPQTLHALRTANVCNWSTKTQTIVTASKLRRVPFSRSSAVRSTSSESSSSAGDDDDNGDEASSHGESTHEAEGGDDGPQVTVTCTTRRKPRVRGNYRWKYRRSYTPGDMQSAAQNDEPVYFMITPPDQPDPGLLRDVYMDTSTLEWLYDPPIPVVAAQIPEHMNLSTVLVLYHPSSQQYEQKTESSKMMVPHPTHLGGSPHSFAHDYYMFTSYVMPAAQLVVSGHTDSHGYYSVSYRVTTSPTAIYYDYNSLTQRYALFELRNGPDGPEKVFLIPVHLSGGSHNRKVIKGKLLPHGALIPESYYAFLVFSASIHLYVPELPTL